MATDTLPAVDGLETLDKLRVKIFADGADKKSILELCRKPYIRGFTTNPSLMRQAGVQDYSSFAKEIIEAIPDRPISFEVFTDDFAEMERQAKIIASWGENVYVKIPVTNTRRQPAFELIERLSNSGTKVNATAVMTLTQVEQLVDVLADGAPSVISIFAGRIADSGRDPVPMVKESVKMARYARSIEILWASTRELLNIYHAESAGCHVITVTDSILKRVNLIGKSLSDYSLETVEMFYNDAKAAGFIL